MSVVYRELTNHTVVEDTAPQLTLQVMDSPDCRGACHWYAATGQTATGVFTSDITFQEGPVKECGLNGWTEEALTAILIDRLRCFQAGPYACGDNAEAFNLYKQALHCLQRRTLGRIDRGVEGTYTV